MKRIYLDHNATTPLDTRVRAEMEPWWGADIGNASSVHAEGRKARGAVDNARDRVARRLGVKPSEIIFTGGGTESNNLAVQGLARSLADKGRHVITSQGEHHAVLQACEALEKYEGFRLTRLPLDAGGAVDPERLSASFSDDTTLVSIMSANNETGVKNPVAEIGRRCAERGILFHTDAVQSAGKEPLDMGGWNASALSLTAHKFYGPPGAGVLVVRAGFSIRKLMFGGEHENGRRPGTENVAAISGLAAALDLPENQLAEEWKRQREWIEALWAELRDLPGLRRNGDAANRLPNTLNASFAGLDGEELLMSLDLAGLAVSSGSACLVGSVQTSHVLQAMGIPEEEARATVRFSIGKGTPDEAVPDVAARVRRVVEHQLKVHAS